MEQKADLRRDATPSAFAALSASRPRVRATLHISSDAMSAGAQRDGGDATSDIFQNALEGASHDLAEAAGVDIAIRRADARMRLSRPPKRRIVAVTQHFSGACEGSATAALLDESDKALGDALRNEGSHSLASGDLPAEVLGELAGIILNRLVARLADAVATDLHAKPAIPYFGPAATVFADIKARLGLGAALGAMIASEPAGLGGVVVVSCDPRRGADLTRLMDQHDRVLVGN